MDRRQSSGISGKLAPPPRSFFRRRGGAPPPPRPAGAVPVLPNPQIPGADDGEQSTLPTDLLLEIAARSDAISIVRCAATSKPLRLAILGQAFRSQLALTRGTHFDPDLLRGVSYKVDDRRSRRKPVQRVVQPPTEPALVRFTQIVGLEFEPVACRDGLVVLRRSYPYSFFHPAPSLPGELLRVCNSITGHTSNLPDSDIIDINKHALLTVDNHGGSNFELLVVAETLQNQLYSSRDGRWGPVRTPHPKLPFLPIQHSCPVVIGCTAHWLCSPLILPQDQREMAVIALHADTAQATLIELPFTSTMEPFSSASRSLILGASPDGRLMVVVAEDLVISMWTLVGEPSRSSLLASWTRELLVDKKDWVFGLTHSLIRFEGFGERTGSVLFMMGRTCLVQLDLSTKKVVVLFQSSNAGIIVSQACLHEIRLPSLLQAMKPELS